MIFIWPGTARRGAAGRGKEGQGEAGRGMVGRGEARHGKAWQAGLGAARHGMAWRDMARQARQGKAWRGKARQGGARQGRHGKAMNNTELKQKYDEMHTKGKSAWFDDGETERQALFDMGIPWNYKLVLEIGCGEGDLLNRIWNSGASVVGIDYSYIAVMAANRRYPLLNIFQSTYEDVEGCFDTILMQGVLEHLDDPFVELWHMIDRFKPNTVIMSMPGFVNTRGIVWHTLDMLGAVMSKTDLHFINPWEVQQFCDEKGYRLSYTSIEKSWASGPKMIEDLRQRIPLALRDGNIAFKQDQLEKFLIWLEKASLGMRRHDSYDGAVIIYRIDL